MRSTVTSDIRETISGMVFFFLVLTGSVAFGEIQVDTDFPGGSGEVTQQKEKGQTVLRLDPADHPGKGWRCWWYVKLRGLPSGEPLILDVGEAPWATPDQAAYSIDGGQTWLQTEKGVREGKRIRYPLKLSATAAEVAWGPPFVPGDAAALVERLAEKLPEAVSFSLCETREGRETPALRIGPAGDGDTQRPLVWLQARQHAWESGSSWVAKGVGEWLVSDAPEAVALRGRAEIVLVPIMDIDNVHRGAGGKNQKPQDHNRDWGDAPHWNAVAAAQKEIGKAAEENRLAAFIDLHNPGANDRFPYFYVSAPEVQTREALENQSIFIDSQTQIPGVTPIAPPGVPVA